MCILFTLASVKMPEPQEEIKKTGGVEENKPSKILEFFSATVKEPKKEKIKPFTKVVIRRLPPRLTKDAFLEEFELPEHDYFCFVRGDMSMGQLAFSRAYVNFHKGDDIFVFKEKYDDYLLQDDQGKEYHAVVEWAPVQKIPKRNSQKKASQAGTIEADQKYVEFLEKLEKEKNNVANSSGYFMETEGVSSKEAKITTTPLLEFLRVRKQQKLELKLKRREAEKERRRKEDEARKTEKMKRVREKKTEDKVESIEQKDQSKTKSDVPQETKERKTDGKPVKTDKPGVTVKSRVFEKRDRAAAKESTETSSKPRNPPESKTKKDAESKKTGKPSHRPSSTPAETDSSKTSEGSKPVKKEDGDSRKEAKSKFRYSEQRNRERTQKPHKKEEIKAPKESSKEKPEEENQHEERRIRRQSTQDTSDGSVEGDEKSGEKDDRNSKDPRTERRIRNKDRPTMQIYRPGMGRFSKQRQDQKKDDDASESDDRKSDRSRGERKKSTRSVKTEETLAKEEGDELVDEKIDAVENQIDDIPAEDEIQPT